MKSGLPLKQKWQHSDVTDTNKADGLCVGHCASLQLSLEYPKYLNADSIVQLVS